jgi:hypothetical protein
LTKDGLKANKKTDSIAQKQSKSKQKATWNEKGQNHAPTKNSQYQKKQED